MSPRSAQPVSVLLDDNRAWLRVADAAWDDPIDPRFANVVGGRWNSPGDGPTLYLCADVVSARAQIHRLLDPTPVNPEDLVDDAPFVLVTVRLPARQRVADAATDVGLQALGLPRSYPVRRNGAKVAWADCRRAARLVRAASLRGVLARGSWLATNTPSELAWFPAARSRAKVVGESVTFSRWYRGDVMGSTV